MIQTDVDVHLLTLSVKGDYNLPRTKNGRLIDLGLQVKYHGNFWKVDYISKEKIGITRYSYEQGPLFVSVSPSLLESVE